MEDLPKNPKFFFKAETLEELKDKLYSVLAEEPFDVQIKEIPQLKPEHIWDFEEGVRLIVTFDKFPDNTVLLHVSASVQSEKIIHELMDLLPDVKALSERLKEIVGNLFDSVCGFHCNLKPTIVSDKAVHFEGPTRDVFRMMLGWSLTKGDA